MALVSPRITTAIKERLFLVAVALRQNPAFPVLADRLNRAVEVEPVFSPVQPS